MFLGDTLCNLGSIIILMSIETFKKIEGLRMTPTEKLVGVVNGTLHETEGVVFNVQVEVECPMILGRPFLANSKARINLEHK